MYLFTHCMRDPVYTRCDPSFILPVWYYYRPQRSWGKVMFLQVCVILFTGWGGVPDQVHPPPWTRYTPRDQVHPPGTTPRPGTPPGTRYTPLDQVHPPWTRYTPLGPGPPLDQVHPQTRYTPLDQVHPPKTRYPPDQVHPWDHVHPPWDQVPPRPGTPPLAPGTPPDQVPPPGTREIQSTRRRYASYWNAILLGFKAVIRGNINLLLLITNEVAAR